MTRSRKGVAILSWVLAALGGGWVMLTLLSAYMTTTGYLDLEDVRTALPLPVFAILISLAIHLWPRIPGTPSPWPWCLPVYLGAGGPVILLLTVWLDQRYFP